MRTSYEGPLVVGVREQARIVNGLLHERFERLLPRIMREAGFDMWIVVCNEDNHDPIFDTIIPWECWAPILQIVVFHDAGPERGVERLNISLTDMQGLMTSVWSLDHVDTGADKEAQRANSQWATLRRLVEERNPARIGIDQSDVIWAADGLTATLKERLVDALGPDLSARLESAEPMCVRWLETRLPEEIELYHQACAVSHRIIARCFSREVVTPGLTTCEDLRWAYWQGAADLGLPVSFPAFMYRLRGPENRARWGDDDVIRAGDMVRCDVGLKYLRLLTDHQEIAYVLRPGETDAPQSFRDAMAQGNRLQDVFVDTWELGLTGNEILTRALRRATEEGIPKPKIYSHSLSHYLHEPGPLMGLPWEQTTCPGRGDVAMNYDTAYTVELSVTQAVPDWDGQDVTFAMEQDAVFTKDGPRFLDGRQTAFHLI
jgi:Xaa-Pro aminopeptidase